jgi:hypothetical protein
MASNFGREIAHRIHRPKNSHAHRFEGMQIDSLTLKIDIQTQKGHPAESYRQSKGLEDPSDIVSVNGGQETQTVEAWPVA